MIPISEQETVIQFNREGNGCTIWTSDSTMITKLNRLCKTASTFYKLVRATKTQDGEAAGNLYELSDKKMLSLRSVKPSRPTKVLSEEEKAAMVERLREARIAKKNSENEE